MAELTKNDIKEVFVQSIEPFAGAIQKDIQRLDEKIDKVDSNLGGKIDKIDAQLTSVEQRLSNVEQDVKWMKENSSAIFTKLDRFITMYERQYQEFLAMNEHLNRLEKDFEERIKALELKIHGV